ncbi:NACHT domain-containing protein [Mucilaginibacter sp. BJC16-A38]|uniref:NACHT domain-containing protein n=1 Tax=Mucilaginibacter phenanthrenivorans TaxID=1234842 RepID=UPI002157C929|nr:NACHT domain-containing protein [Mucilaginibacter phenanthrenivorans]MCR8559441.1 NACHT domain-containing protein [Mucilaginibacter phenanthrenivorans]
MELFKDLIERALGKLKLSPDVYALLYNRIKDFETEEYNRCYYSKTILHRTEPVKLNEFYQPLFIRKYGKNHRDERIETHSSSNLFGSNRFITLLGTAGSGKSTIVKYLSVNCADINFKIPVKIELRYLNKYNGTLLKFIEEEIFKCETLNIDKRTIAKVLNSGEFVFFFDGYDELSSTIKERTTKEINDFTTSYSNNYYLLTSRPYTNIELLSGFSNFEVCELNNDEIEQFVRKQIPTTEHEISSKILEAINEDSNQSYMTFLSNPLLLSMFILTFQTYSNIPPKKSAFYHQVFDSLYYLHDSMSKLAYDREKKSGLSKEQFEQVLKMFSYISFFKQIFVFDEAFINSILDKIKENKKNLTFSNEHLLDDLQVAICILQKEGLDYVFPHRSLQEYFSSLYIVGLEGKPKQEAYLKIYNSLKNYDIIELITKDNFFSLLVEQDEQGVIKHLTIPFLEQITNDLKSSITSTKGENISMSMLFYLSMTHSKLDILSGLLAIVSDFSIARMGIMRDNLNPQSKRTLTLTVSKNANAKIKEILEPHIKSLKLNVPKFTKSLKLYLNEEIESDSSIIDLI